MMRDRERRLIFVVESPFSERDARRFGVDIFLENGFRVEAWEVAPLTLPRSELQWFQDVVGLVPTRFTSLQHLARCAESLLPSDVIVSLVAVTRDSFFRRRAVFSKLSASSAMLCTLVAAVPVATESEPQTAELVNRWKRWISLRYKGFIDVSLKKGPMSIVVRRSVRWLLGIRPLDWAWVPTRNHNLHPLLFLDHCTVRVIHSLDFDALLELQGSQLVRRGTALLVDGMGPLHPDHITHNIEPALGPPMFFDLVTRALNFIELTMPLSVEVAAHPRAEPGSMETWYPHWVIHYSDSVRALAESDLVLFYYPSTLVGIAVAMRKPIAILTLEGTASQDSRWCDELAKALDLSVIRVDECGVTATTRELDELLYRDFEFRHVKESDSLTQRFWDVVIQDLNAQEEASLPQRKNATF